MADTTREAVERLIQPIEKIVNYEYSSRDALIHNCDLGTIDMGQLSDMCAALRALLIERDAAQAEVARLTAALAEADERKWGSIGAGAVGYLREMYPEVAAAMKPTARTSLRNWINNRVKSTLAEAETAINDLSLEAKHQRGLASMWRDMAEKTGAIGELTDLPLPPRERDGQEGQA